MEDWEQWTSARLGHAVALRPVEGPHEEAQVWRVEAGGRTLAFLKRHRTSDKWTRERTVLEHLATEPPAPVPAVLAVDEAARVLLLSALPGARADRMDLALAERRSLHEQAGRFRRRLDAVPVEVVDPMPVPDAIETRHRAWCDRARPHLSPALLTRVERSLDPRCFEGVARRWCHRDLAPHNWIVPTSATPPRLGIIDFGQARPDVWLVDVLKLWAGPWVEHPALADAFWDGYGRRPSSTEERRLHQLALLHGLATATWGDHHEDAERSREGRAVLQRVLEELER